MDDEEMEALFGPPARFSDHKRGETIRFNLRGQDVEGLIMWVAAPSTTVKGRHAPITYICSVEDEITPTLVYPGEVLEDQGQQ